MVITNRELPSGTVLTARFKKQEHSCTVEVDGEGKRSYLIGEKRFTSPSAAASSITGGAINGWSFWSVQGDGSEVNADFVGAAKEMKKAEKRAKREAQPKARVEKPAKADRKPRSPKKLALIERMEDGRFFCKACMEAFTALVPEGQLPDECANGHRADDAELTAAPAPEAVEAEQQAVGAEA